MSKKIFRVLFPWFLILFGLFSLDLFMGIPGGVAIILGITMLIDRVLPEYE